MSRSSNVATVLGVMVGIVGVFLAVRLRRTQAEQDAELLLSKIRGHLDDLEFAGYRLAD